VDGRLAGRRGFGAGRPDQRGLQREQDGRGNQPGGHVATVAATGLASYAGGHSEPRPPRAYLVTSWRTPVCFRNAAPADVPAARGLLGWTAAMLAELEVVVVDCQASGATPRHGSLLEMGWAVTGAQGYTVPVQACWVAPPPGTRVPRAVRELTGWHEGCLAGAVPATQAWSRLLAAVPAWSGLPAPCVMHFARFELTFLQELHQQHAEGPFPLDTVCLHEVARRLFPELPRRGIRALAGYLGHSPELVRRSAGHVDASAFIWRAVQPALERAGVRTWDELKVWLHAKAPPRGRRTYPLPAERRRAMPGRPGVYRFVRSNGDVLYVGKAANLRKRIASHFTRGGKATERALEMLTQVHDIDVTQAETVLEAALLETDEIKRLQPPYNVQLREDDRRVWFATADLTEAAAVPDGRHRVGPLPSRWSLASMAALRALAGGADLSSLRTRADAVGVPPPFAPEEGLFRSAWQAFCAQHLPPAARNPWHALLRASRQLALTGVADDSGEESGPDEWDLDRIRRHLDRALLRGGQLVRRARWLVLLSDASVAFREPGGGGFRLLVVERGQIVDRRDLPDTQAVPGRETPPPWQLRQACLDAAGYDRMRVLATELVRVRAEGGAVLVRIGARLIDDRRSALLVG
jgi:DNA polymerase-3 subunit epsilon